MRPEGIVRIVVVVDERCLLIVVVKALSQAGESVARAVAEAAALLKALKTAE